MPVHGELGSSYEWAWIQKYSVSLFPSGTKEYLGVYKASNHAVQMIPGEIPLGGKLQEHYIFHMVQECCILGHELVASCHLEVTYFSTSVRTRLKPVVHYFHCVIHMVDDIPINHSPKALFHFCHVVLI